VHAAVARSTSPSQNAQNTSLLEVDAAARSTCPSQNVQSTPGSEHFLKLRRRKSARRCGAKHISKSKVLKTDGLGPLLEVEMLKKVTQLWREAHFQVKMHETHKVRSTF